MEFEINKTKQNRFKKRLTDQQKKERRERLSDRKPKKRKAKPGCVDFDNYPKNFLIN
jgi:hypothetical protein